MLIVGSYHLWQRRRRHSIISSIKIWWWWQPIDIISYEYQSQLWWLIINWWWQMSLIISYVHYHQIRAPRPHKFGGHFQSNTNNNHDKDGDENGDDHIEDGDDHDNVDILIIMIMTMMILRQGGYSSNYWQPILVASSMCPRLSVFLQFDKILNQKLWYWFEKGKHEFMFGSTGKVWIETLSLLWLSTIPRLNIVLSQTFIWQF